MVTPVGPPRAFLEQLFAAALQAALPDVGLKAFLPEPPAGRTIVVGAGKAAASMALALENGLLGEPGSDVAGHWPEPIEGLVVTRYGHGLATRSIEVVEAAHPVPDDAGLDAARRILALAESAQADDLVICLLSGGASALLTLPAPGITLAEKRAVNEALLRSGAPIDAMNVIRKCLSAIKGGRLGAAIAPAPAVSLLISDVPGDSPAVIGSGPTVADPTATPAAALELADRYKLDLTAAVRSALGNSKPVGRLPENQSVAIVAAPQMSLQAAADYATAQGVTAMILGDAIEGEAREVARVMAGIVLQVVRHEQPLHRPCVLLSGGETTVTLRGESGRGGRNSEFLLALAIALDGCPDVHAIACDTDGIDGTENNAGACIGPDTLRRGQASGLNAQQYLDRNEAYAFFDATDALITTGPTLTNVNDFRAIYIASSPGKVP